MSKIDVLSGVVFLFFSFLLCSCVVHVCLCLSVLVCVRLLLSLSFFFFLFFFFCVVSFLYLFLNEWIVEICWITFCGSRVDRVSAGAGLRCGRCDATCGPRAGQFPPFLGSNWIVGKNQRWGTPLEVATHGRGRVWRRRLRWRRLLWLALARTWPPINWRWVAQPDRKRTWWIADGASETSEPVRVMGRCNNLIVAGGGSGAETDQRSDELVFKVRWRNGDATATSQLVWLWAVMVSEWVVRRWRVKSDTKEDRSAIERYISRKKRGEAR